MQPFAESRQENLKASSAMLDVTGIDNSKEQAKITQLETHAKKNN
ncbi:hypothetical protein [Ochrobactrum sp. Marseille-Q0166]|nr:hypothetical protein [Ochrobactrum sp. Marseille-Q0166]